MEFRRFGSIENSYRDKFIDQMKKEALNGGDFVVEEKVHGANFSFWCDGEEIKCGKRSSFVDKNFNNSNKVLADHTERLRSLYVYLKSKCAFKDMKELTIYGEIIGGVYKHEDVDKVPQATRVQKGVDYCPQNEFYGFDIMVDGIFLNEYDKCMAFEKHGFLYAKPLFRGSLEECLAYPNEFQTHIPEWLGLPPIEGNVCEGVIIRPEDPRFLNGGSRVILKNKNKKFSEKASAKDKTQKVSEPMEGPTLEAFEKIALFITENRLRNVLSHIGAVTNKDFGKIMGAFNKDIIEDFKKEHNDFNTLEKKESKRVSKEMSRLTSNMLRDNLLNIIDGNF